MTMTVTALVVGVVPVNEMYEKGSPIIGIAAAAQGAKICDESRLWRVVQD
jgi:hypothetical protein